MSGLGPVVKRKGSLALIALAPMLFAMPTADAKARKFTPKPQITLTAPGNLGSFTPAISDPKLAAALARGRETGLRFTPAGSPGSRRSVTVAIRSRGAIQVKDVTPVPAHDSIAPVAYNLGVSVGWKRFALSGDYAKLDTGIAPFGRESVDVGLSYLGKNWRGTVQLGTDRDLGDKPLLTGGDRRYSVDVGGAYSVSRNLAVTGGLRYQRELDDGLFDHKRDAQSVYVGTAFTF